MTVVLLLNYRPIDHPQPKSLAFVRIVAFLLYMAAEMQCWGRPTFEELQHKPKSLGDAEVTLKAFSKGEVQIEIHTQGDPWNEEQQEAVGKQVSRLRRMLRLAVDTRNLADRYLFFQIANNHSQKCYLELRDGAIRKCDEFG